MEHCAEKPTQCIGMMMIFAVMRKGKTMNKNKVTIQTLIAWNSIKDYMAKNDVIQVIRCKDCKKFVKEEDQTYCIDMFGQCDENGFCAWAERKENETD